MTALTCYACGTTADDVHALDLNGLGPRPTCPLCYLETGRLSIIVLDWLHVLDTDGTHVGYVAETRLGFFPCDLDGAMLAGAERTAIGADQAVRDLLYPELEGALA